MISLQTGLCDRWNCLLVKLFSTCYTSPSVSLVFLFVFVCFLLLVFFPPYFLLLLIIIMYIYHALINALSAHMIQINLNMIFYTHVEHSPTKNNLYKVLYKKQNALQTHTHTQKAIIWQLSYTAMMWPITDNASTMWDPHSSKHISTPALTKSWEGQCA